jgi:hypothetical protein
MPTDYIVFIHGVNTRVEPNFREQAQKTFDNIKANITPDPNRNLKPVMLFWGDIAKESTELLGTQLSKESSAWQKIWFQDLRLKQVLSFVGDAALYLSRTVSIDILKKLTDQAVKQIMNSEDIKQQLPLERNSGDRLHLVTHSWGTVILFDILFATRWEEASLPPETKTLVEHLRSYFFGVASSSEKQETKNVGIPIASLHTMGSPISLFNLINAASGKGKTLTFNLTPNLKEFLQSSAELAKKPLPWQNFIHPGDPIAYPLEGAMRSSLGADAQEFVKIDDIVTKAKMGAQFFNLFGLGIIAGGEAHGSYWENVDVAKDIAKVIQSTFPTPPSIH